MIRILGRPLEHPLVGSAVAAFSLKMVNTALSLGTSVLVARLLGADSYGMYAFAIACVTLLEVPAQLGLPTLVVRLTAAYAATGEWSRLRGLLRRAGQITIAGQVLLAGSLGVALLIFSDRFDREAFHTALWALALMPLVVLGTLRAAALNGLHHVLLSQIPSLLVRPGLFLALLGLTAFGLQWKLTPSAALALQVAATSGAFLLGLWWLWRRMPAPLKTATPTYQTAQWMRSAWPLMLIGGIGVVNSQVDILMLGVLRTPEEVGVYRVAIQVANLVGFASAGINVVIAPTLSRLHVEGARRRLQRVMTRSTQAAFFLFALPVGLTLMLAGGELLPLVFSQSFAAGQAPLSILCIAQLATAGTGAAGLLLSMTGHEKDVARGLALAAILNVCLNAVLIPRFGMEGAAAATATSQVLWSVALGAHVYWRLAIRPTAFVRT